MGPIRSKESQWIERSQRSRPEKASAPHCTPQNGIDRCCRWSGGHVSPLSALLVDWKESKMRREGQKTNERDRKRQKEREEERERVDKKFERGKTNGKQT